jgi:very-short-patch-repair endonuclease
MDTFKFIQKAKEVHGDKFDYSNVIYKNCDTKVDIKCINCNTAFKQIPYNHINKKTGCIKCNISKKKEKTLQLRLNDFIEKAKKLHNNKYDYSKVNYNNSKTLIIIICNICGKEFEQMRNTHLKGNGGCKECQKNKYKKEMTFTTEQFIQKAKIIHGNNYNYSQVDYINSQIHIILICNTCGNNFPQLPNNHLRARGCKKCANKIKAENKRKLPEQFISESKSIHIDENKLPVYDYSLVEYVSTHKKVIIICKIHGNYEQAPSAHLSGSGCNKCSINIRSKKQTFTQEQFIQKAKEIHVDKFDYSKVNYINSHTHIIVICNTCGIIFTQLPNSHLQGYGCDNCAHIINHTKQKLTENEIIRRSKEVHGDKFDYSKVNYINSKIPINIKCNHCNNMFQQNYRNHIIQNKGCPLCENRKTEKILYDYLITIYSNIIREFKQEWCKNKNCLPFDFCISELNIIIELDGNQHFEQVMNWKTPEENQKTDKYKMKCANENNYSVIRIIQNDVIHNKYNWKEELNNNIEKIKNDNIIQNIYMCKYNDYEIFK